MVNPKTEVTKTAYAEFKALLSLKSDAEIRLNEISAAIKKVELHIKMRNEHIAELHDLQQEEVKMGKIWTQANDAILQHQPQSYQEAALKVLHLTNGLNVEDENERAILAIKDCALVLYQLETAGEEPFDV